MAECMIYLKKHKTENGSIIAMCDSDLINKVLNDGIIEINIKDYSSFYNGDLLSVDKALEQINAEEVYSANIVGSESIKVAVKCSIIEKSNVKKVKDIPYAQAFSVKR
jgi:hypothetical protein